MFSFSALPLLLLLLLLLLVSPPSSSSPLTKHGFICGRTFCGAGRECVLSDRAEPECRCLQSCDEAERWVCGSNRKSYRSHCELHRDACLTRTRIHVKRRGRCRDEAARQEIQPVVCFLSDRDGLREKVIRWVRAEAESNGLTASEDALKIYFQLYDSGGDQQLDSKEFLNFLKHNRTVLELTYSDAPETNLLIRSMCVDALLQLSDENSDWKLSFVEFRNGLTDGYQLPERRCSLEGGVFEEGARAQMDCNKCVCACGNWVCTALVCSSEGSPRVQQETGAEELSEQESD